MKINFHKLLSDVLCWLSIAFAVAHFIWCAGVGYFDLQSLLLNVIPYGVPVFTFVLVRREFRRESPRWNKADTVFYVLLTLIYLAMILHVTVQGIIADFTNVYFNVPIIYSIPITLTDVLWLIIRMKPEPHSTVIVKILYTLPLITIVTMVVHCGVLLIIEWTRNINNNGFPQTSFPWWGMPLLFGILYLLGVVLLFALYVLYRYVQNRKEKSAIKTL